MAFNRKLLVQGEDVVLELRPHPWAIVGSAVITVLIIAAGIWLLGLFDNSALRWTIVAGVVIIFGIYPARKLAGWFSTIFVVTNQRVIHRRGWIARSSMEIPLSKINDVRFVQGIFGRMIGAGTLILESGGEMGKNEFQMIRNPEEVQRTIYEVARNAENRGSGQAPAANSQSVAPSTTGELERLAELRDNGVLTEEEFQAQKSKILGQS